MGPRVSTRPKLSGFREHEPKGLNVIMPSHRLLSGALAALLLTTSLAGCSAISSRETAGEYVDDATISTKIRAQLVDKMGLHDVSVETMQNTVQLSGFVESNGTKAEAGRIARQTRGVKSVKNDLVVR
ncbi:MAG: BON domain-containing protein [Amphiplicatus sp.]